MQFVIPGLTRNPVSFCILALEGMTHLVVIKDVGYIANAQLRLLELLKLIRNGIFTGKDANGLCLQDYLA
jgi:hypothetical protein